MFIRTLSARLFAAAVLALAACREPVSSSLMVPGANVRHSTSLSDNPATVAITIDPASFAGIYNLVAENQPESLPFGTGVRTAQVLPGRYALRVLEGAYAITVAQDGTVSADDAIAVTGGPNRATLNTVAVTVDPADFPLQYSLHDGRFAPNVGTAVFSIPRNATFAINVGTEYIAATIDGLGNVTSLNAAAALGSQARLTFHTIPIVVDPVAFNSVWMFHGGDREVGQHTVPLVPNLHYAFQFGDAPKTFPQFFLDSLGNTSPYLTTGLIGGTRKVTFRNVVAHVTTSVPGATWQLHGASYGPVAFIGYGDQDIVLIPDVGFFFERDDVDPTVGGAYFVVGDPCSITPNVFVIKGVTYTMNCGPLVPPDNTPPLIHPTVTGTLGSNGWYTSDVNVSWSVSDPESGVSTSSGCGPISITVDANATTWTCAATNGAGLTSTRSVSIARDATPPVITFTGNLASYNVDQNVAIHCMASDARSGLASTTCTDISVPAYTYAVGSNNVSATAIDRAGNTSSSSVSFRVVATAMSVCSLVTQWVNKSGVAHSLCTKLDHGSYDAFRNELDAQVDKSISAENAAILRRLVSAL